MPTSNRFIIMFYNLENLFDTKNDLNKNDDNFLPSGKNNWTNRKYTDKINKISDSIFSIPGNKVPLIIGVSEIENKTVLKDLVNQPRFNSKYKFIHYESGDKRGIDVALIYNIDYFHILSHEKIMAVNPDDVYTTRDILYVKGQIDSDIVHFFVNHWPSRREGTLKSMPRRITAANCLYKRTQELIKENSLAKIVIMGDFNDLPVSKSLSTILRAKSYRNITNDQFYNLASIPHRNKMGTVFAKNQWFMFDQIIISKGMINEEDIKIKSSRLTIHFYTYPQKPDHKLS
jgi:predicted extracellular nuclease